MSSNNDNSNDNDLFRAFVNDIAPLNTKTVAPTLSKPKARVKKPTIDTKPNLRIDKTSQVTNDSFFAFHISKKIKKNFKAGHIHFDATLDLHGHTVSQSERLISQFIDDCSHHKIKYAIIIHGQGHNSEHGSVLKPAVLHWLSQQDHVDAYCPAQPRDGGKGASYVLFNSSLKEELL